MASPMRTLSARTVEMPSCSPVVSRSFTSRRASTTSQSAARSARTPRRPVWRVALLVVVAEAAVAVSAVAVMEAVAEEAEAHVTPSRRVIAPEAAPADSVTRVAEAVEEAAVEVSVAVAVAAVTLVVAEEAEVSATLSRRATAPEAVLADSVTIKSVISF